MKLTKETLKRIIKEEKQKPSRKRSRVDAHGQNTDVGPLDRTSRRISSNAVSYNDDCLLQQE